MTFLSYLIAVQLTEKPRFHFMTSITCSIEHQIWKVHVTFSHLCIPEHMKRFEIKEGKFNTAGYN